MRKPTTPDLTAKYDAQSQSARAYEAVRDAILSGRFGPGTRLKEHAICKMFGLSRTPVRHAFARLVSDGLVEQIPNVGCFVRRLSIEEEIELMGARQVLEAGAAALAAEWANDEQLAELLRLAKLVEDRRERARSHEIQGSDLLDEELHFHRKVIALSGNSEIERMCNSVYRMFMTLTVNGKANPMPTGVTHVDIAEAIASRKPAKAFDTMWRHLGVSASRWRRMLEDQTAPARLSPQSTERRSRK